MQPRVGGPGEDITEERTMEAGSVLMLGWQYTVTSPKPHTT